jgi:outer membrane protein assembly factor BamC
VKYHTKTVNLSKLVKPCLYLTVTATLSSCGFLAGDDGMFRDRSNDYRQAVIEPALQMPEGVAANAANSSYDIPVTSDRTTLNDKFVVPGPEPLSEDIGREAVTINNLSGQSWILVNGSPGKVWPRLRAFLNLNQFAVTRADATKGIIETDWLQPSTENTLQERYRLRVEQGVQRETSEVYLLQVDAGDTQTEWPTESSNPERESLMTQELAQYLADNSISASVSMLVEQTMDSSGKITIEEANGQPYLNLKLPFLRAWASVGNALTKAHFKVDDLNRSERAYYIQAIENLDKDGEKQGFFASLFTRSKDEQTAGENYLLTVKEQGTNSVYISIQQPNGEALEKTDAERLLKLIKRHIS